MNRRSRTWAAGTVLLAAGMLVPVAGFAQSAVVGALGNFDAANYEGKDAHGLEVQIEGIQLGDLSPSWCGNKYNCPVVEPYATGVYVRYKSTYDPASGTFLATTVPHPAGTAFAGTCYTFSPTYLTAGCDHFGVHLSFTAAASHAVVTAYRWLFADPNNPGQLVASTNNIFVPAPVYTWVAPAQPAAPPVLVAEIQLPDPPPPPPAAPPQFGNATWMKVYKTDMTREVLLTELTSGNPIVPQNVAQLETEWSLLQPAPPAAPGDNRRRRNRQANQGGVNAGTRAILRRYETYAYTGAYDPVTHEVRCAGDGTCTVPQPGELGDMLVAQMVAANVAVPSLTVVPAGSGKGTVSSGDKVLSCPNKCTSTYVLGTAVTLTAKAASGSTFTGWAGACTGSALTCVVTIGDSVTVTATFTSAPPAGGGGGGGGGGAAGGGATQFTVQASGSNSGVTTSDLPGINCGSSCSAKFNAGTVVTLTATPIAGKTFVNWSGACSGTVNTCTLTVNSNLSVQAIFSK